MDIHSSIHSLFNMRSKRVSLIIIIRWIMDRWQFQLSMKTLQIKIAMKQVSNRCQRTSRLPINHDPWCMTKRAVGCVLC